MAFDAKNGEKVLQVLILTCGTFKILIFVVKNVCESLNFIVIYVVAYVPCLYILLALSYCLEFKANS